MKKTPTSENKNNKEKAKDKRKTFFIILSFVALLHFIKKTLVIDDFYNI